jgi:hypothetical protein
MNAVMKVAVKHLADLPAQTDRASLAKAWYAHMAIEGSDRTRFFDDVDQATVSSLAGIPRSISDEGPDPSKPFCVAWKRALP